MQISLLLFVVSSANSECCYCYHQKQTLCLVTDCDAQTSISAIAKSNIGRVEVKTQRSLRRQHMLDHQGPDVLCAVPVIQQRTISSDACLDAPAICTSNTLLQNHLHQQFKCFLRCCGLSGTGCLQMVPGASHLPTTCIYAVQHVLSSHT